MPVRTADIKDEANLYRLLSLRREGKIKVKNYVDITNETRRFWKRRMAFDLEYQRNKEDWLRK